MVKIKCRLSFIYLIIIVILFNFISWAFCLYYTFCCIYWKTFRPFSIVSHDPIWVSLSLIIACLLVPIDFSFFIQIKLLSSINRYSSWCELLLVWKIISIMTCYLGILKLVILYKICICINGVRLINLLTLCPSW